MTQRTALVTGGNRGIGLEVARQLAGLGLQVYLAGRDAGAVNAAVSALADPLVSAVTLDVSDRGSVAACANALRVRKVHVDVLVNNAGIYPDGGILDAPSEAFVEALNVNALGALWCARAFMPQMLANGYGRIVCMTSGYGSFASGLGGPAAYAISKATLNAITLKLAQAAAGDVKVNAVDPGWVRTRMGGSAAPRSVEEAAADVVWAATLPPDGPHGCLLRHRRVAAW